MHDDVVAVEARNRYIQISELFVTKCTHSTGYRAADTRLRHRHIRRFVPRGIATGAAAPSFSIRRPTRLVGPSLIASRGFSFRFSYAGRGFSSLPLLFTSLVCFCIWERCHLMSFQSLSTSPLLGPSIEVLRFTGSLDPKWMQIIPPLMQ